DSFILTVGQTAEDRHQTDAFVRLMAEDTGHHLGWQILRNVWEDRWDTSRSCWVSEELLDDTRCVTGHDVLIMFFSKGYQIGLPVITATRGESGAVCILSACACPYWGTCSRYLCRWLTQGAVHASGTGLARWAYTHILAGDVQLGV
ncbi:hypothetical protein BaRGS_00004932, partial [Batillaria attramentaria]